jgi:hypothetical protein
MYHSIKKSIERFCKTYPAEVLHDMKASGQEEGKDIWDCLGDRGQEGAES